MSDSEHLLSDPLLKMQPVSVFGHFDPMAWSGITVGGCRRSLVVYSVARRSRAVG
jgi:hypothetical protein